MHVHFWHKRLQILLLCMTGLVQRSQSAVDYDTAELFLRQSMPLKDNFSLSDDFISTNILNALNARQQAQWEDIPDDVFLNYVLPYSSMNEERDGCRHFLRPIVLPLIEDLSSISEAALNINKLLWNMRGKWKLYFKPNQTPEIMSPTQVVRAGYASCTGMSIFLVCALRSVGIPARVTGTQAWRTGPKELIGYNHDWVEVYANGTWSFTGPLEWTSEGWNRTWFYPVPAAKQKYGDREHAIYATSWEKTRDGSFPLSWDPDDNSVKGIDVTEHYKNVEIKVYS